MVQKILKLFSSGYPSFWKKNNSYLDKMIILFLLPFSFIYLLIALLNKFIQKPKSVGVPVICVGNITVGGSGKTPIVLYLSNLLKKRKKNVHIVSRGYLGKLKGPEKVNIKHHALNDVGDEALLIAKTDNVWVSKNKYEGVFAATINGADVILLDDGLQNYSIKKDLNCMVVDGNFGFGNNLILPSGPLRESVYQGLKKTDLLFILDDNKNKILRNVNKKVTVIPGLSKIKNHKRLMKKKIIAFAGIGRPDKFFESLKKEKLNIINFFSYPDHYAYSIKEINKLINLAKKNKAHLVTTKKDMERIDRKQRKKISFLDLEIVIKEEKKLLKFLKHKKIV